MKYNVIERDDPQSAELTAKFHRLAQVSGLIHEAETPDVVVSIGGDGTMLQAMHLYIEQLHRISFVGIHTGHLGFFADWKPAELENLVELMRDASMKEEQLPFVSYPVVEIEIQTEQGIETKLALNEFTLRGIEVTLVAQLNINDQLFEMFRGDGICISSPAGSTAYNKSLGGAIVHPSLETIQIAEIASINNRVFRTLGSPILLPKHHYCEILPRANQHILVSLDHLSKQRNDVLAIRCRVAPETKVKFARFRPFPFWTRVREAFVESEFK